MSTISATDVELQKPVNAILEQTLLRNAKARAPYFIGTQPGSLQTQGGSATLKWRRINTAADPGGTGPGPSVTALAELTATSTFMQGRTSVTAAFTDVLATVQKFGQFYVLNEEVDLFTGWSTQNDKLMETLGIVAGRSLNQLQRNVGENNATEVFAGGVATEILVATAVSKLDLQRVLLTLNVNSALSFTPMTTGSTNIGTGPILPSFWAICHPHVAHDVTELAGFQSVATYAGQVETAPFEFGYLSGAGFGVRFVQTEDASITVNGGVVNASAPTLRTGGTNISTYSLLIYGMDAIGTVGLAEQQTVSSFMAGDPLPVIEMIVHPKGSGGIADPFNEIMTMAYKFWHTGAVLNTNWVRSLVVGATDI